LCDYNELLRRKENDEKEAVGVMQFLLVNQYIENGLDAGNWDTCIPSRMKLKQANKAESVYNLPHCWSCL